MCRYDGEKIKYIMNVMQRCALRVEIRKGRQQVSLQIIEIPWGITIMCLCNAQRLGYSISVKNADPICDIIQAETSTGFEVFMTRVALSQLLEDRERIL